MKDRPIIVHSLKDAQAAVTVAAELGVPVTLRSAPGAARYLGAAVFREMIAEASRSGPCRERRFRLWRRSRPGLGRAP
jgi:hypothetical protein